MSFPPMEDTSTAPYEGGSPPAQLIYSTVPAQPHPNDPIGETTECIISAPLLDGITSIPDFPRPLIVITSLTYRLASSHGKGLGFFAVRKLYQGELILNERPIICLPCNWQETVLPLPDIDELTTEDLLARLEEPGERMLEKLLARVSPERRNAYADLIASSAQTAKPLNKRYDSNVRLIDNLYFHLQNSPYGSQYVAVGNVISRVNHSCCPNAHPSFDIPSFSWCLRATRAIEPDEEITMSYLEPTENWELPCDARQDRFHRYGFICQCPVCKEGTPADKRRSVLEEDSAPHQNNWSEELQVDIMEWSEDSSLPDDCLLKESYSVLDKLDQEGMRDTLGYRYHLARINCCYIALSDLEQSRKSFIAMGAHANIFQTEQDTRFLERMGDLLSDLMDSKGEAHPVWGVRKEASRRYNK